MSLKIVLILTILMGFNMYEMVHGEKLYGLDLPRINITALTGKWYQAASNFDIEGCVTYIVDQIGSSNQFTMNTITRAEYNGKNVTFELKLDHELRSDSNKISWSLQGNPGGFLAIFNVVYDSHMAFYRTGANYEQNHKEDSTITILSRTKTLSDEIFYKIKHSEFYLDADKQYWDLYRQNPDYCE